MCKHSITGPSLLKKGHEIFYQHMGYLHSSKTNRGSTYTPTRSVIKVIIEADDSHSNINKFTSREDKGNNLC